MMEIPQQLRHDMLVLLGKLDALSFPLMWQANNEALNQSYYDLVDSIKTQYESILKRLIAYEG